MLYTIARYVWKVAKWLAGLIILFFVAYAANVAVVQEKDVPSTFLIVTVNWLFLSGIHQTLTASFLTLFFLITLFAGILVVVGKQTEDSAGRIQSPTAPTLRGQNRQHLLAKVRAFWITGVLDKSLHGAALIALRLREQPDALADPWKLVLQQPDHSVRPLPSGTRITQVYDEAIGELLILGEPGSGKSTLLLELARDLLDRAEKDENHPIPLVFNLSSWAAKQQPLADWLVEEMNTKYQVPRPLGQAWVAADQVLPLLDGLDEVGTSYRPACAGAINTYRLQHGLVPTVVCCRSTDYQDLTTRLLLGCAVTVQPLTAMQIDDYLSSAGGQLEAVRVALREDQTLQELATTPLMLSVLTLAYYGKPVEDLLAEGSLEIRRRNVFDTYIERMLQRRGASFHYTQEKTMHWLAWLARKLVQQNQTEFYVERLQPDWLPNRRLGLVYRMYICIFIGLIGGLIGGLLVGLIFGLLVGLIFGLIFGLQTRINPAEDIHVPLKSVLSILLFWLIGGLIVELLVGLFGELTFGLLVGLTFGLFGGGAFIQHFILRWLLRRAGCMPWNYPRFLNYATERVLLRKVGGGYIFVHRLLLEYFASLDTKPASDDPTLSSGAQGSS